MLAGLGIPYSQIKKAFIVLFYTLLYSTQYFRRQVVDDWMENPTHKTDSNNDRRARRTIGICIQLIPKMIIIKSVVCI